MSNHDVRIDITTTIVWNHTHSFEICIKLPLLNYLSIYLIVTRDDMTFFCVLVP